MSQEARVVRYHADALDVIPTLVDESVDAVVTDPPYELGFMGRTWDASGIAYNVDLWKQCFRVLKPGGHLLAFGGTRTSHRLAVAVEDAGFEIRDSIVWIYGSGFPKSLDVSKAIDKAAGAEREVIGTKLGQPGYSLAPSNMDHRTYGRGLGNTSNPEAECAVTAPATDDAKRWAGWGTALKPSHEPVICAMKPHTLQQILDTIGSRIGRLEDLWRAPVADPTTPTGAEDGSFGPMVTWPFGSEEPTGWSTVSSWRNCWADLCSRLSTSTTATTSNLTIDLKTLCSLLERITHASTIPDQTAADGLRSLVTAADNLFAAAVLSSRATLALSAIESVTAGMPTSRQDATELVSEPIVVARKPLGGRTVAANVLAHGTGALNIDACRVATDEDRSRPPRTANEIYGGGRGTNLSASESHDAGRWPANVVLDEDAAAELDEQSGTTKSRAGRRNAPKSAGTYGAFAGDDPDRLGHEDEGGASRFFPVFRYQAKAPSRERPKVDGVAHNTVKPLELMRWLVRLVTPPDGVVLEPFAGSGTTVEACILEGMRCLAIEREESYLPLIAQRIERAGLVAW